MNNLSSNYDVDTKLIFKKDGSKQMNKTYRHFPIGIPLQTINLKERSSPETPTSAHSTLKIAAKEREILKKNDVGENKK